VRHAASILILACIAFGSMACTTAPASVEGQVSVKLRIISEKELAAAYGGEYEINPFIAPSSMITGKPDDFVVLALDLALSKPSRIAVEAQALGPEGGEVASFYSMSMLAEFCRQFNVEKVEDKRRMAALKRGCAPGPSFDARPGERRIFIVLVGKHPLPAGTRVKASVSLNGVAACSMDEEIPGAPAPR
jgi:hypothetical protein